MLNKTEAYRKAFEIKEKQKNRKQTDFLTQLEKLENEHDKLKEINQKLNMLGAKTAITALSGDTEALKALKEAILKLNAEKQAFLDNAAIIPPIPDCDKCGDTGYINGKICDCVKSIAKLLILEDLSKSLPLNSSRFEDFSLEFYPEEANDGTNPKKRMTAIFKLCKEYALNFDPKLSENLLFMGNTGIGKTHLSLSIVYELLNKGFDVIYGSAYNLFSAMEDEHFNLRSDVSFKAAVECDLLVIDDLGGEFVSPYIQSLLYNIVNTRLLASRPTIISTNLSMADIESRYTPRVSSRLIGGYVAKKFLGNDIRQIKAMNKNK